MSCGQVMPRSTRMEVGEGAVAALTAAAEEVVVDLVLIIYMQKLRPPRVWLRVTATGKLNLN